MDAATAEAFGKIADLPHSKQAIWYLNGFWEDDEKGDALGEELWGYVEQFQTLENDGPVIKFKGKKAKEQKAYVEGCDLDPHKSHRFLEKVGETLTVVALRKKLETIDIDKNKRMALSEYLLFKFGKTPQELIEAPQGTDQAGIQKAQAKMDEVNAQLAEVQGNLAQVEEQTAEVKAKLEDVKTKLASQKEQEAANNAALEALGKAKAELEAAVAELKKEEEAFATRKAELEKKKEDQSLGVVKRNKASNELAQMLAEDPLPLRKAKITQGAALKRTEKAEKKANKAKVALEAAIKESEQAQKELEEAEKELAASKEELEKSIVELEKQMQEAQEELEECKKRGGVAHGAIWWMEKELKEARKYGKRR
jgi:chromosome segregation ATPase